MGGTVLEVKVKPGDAVKPGDTLLVYEAMKMENNLTADRAGVIAKCLIEDGDVMSTDQPIFEFAGAGAAPQGCSRSETCSQGRSSRSQERGCSEMRVQTCDRH